MERIARGLALASLAVVAAACTDRIDMPGLETRLAQDLQAEYETIFTVSCPEEVEVGKGKNFECTAVGDDGRRVTVQLTQVDDRASVHYEFVEG